MSVQLNGSSLRCLGGGSQVLSNLPASVRDASHQVREATISFNDLQSAEGLEPFAATLETLILDNNKLSSLETLPKDLPKLTTLWLNNNLLSDLDATLDVVAGRCPMLQYLSLLRNPCCPHELNGKNEHEYQRYRVYVKHRLPTLTTLDSEPISEEEASTAKEKGAFYKSVVADQPPPTSTAESSTPAENDEQPKATRWADKDPARPAEAVFSNQRHFYSGKTSEGNRFIGNDML